MDEKPHILLVDDERSIREPLATYLNRNGFRVTQAADAAQARERLHGYAIDLVILDVMMPGEDGLSLCRHIRETSELPVILLTAMAEETDRIVGLEMGADDYLTKPYEMRELSARIKAVLRRAQSETPASAQSNEPQKNISFDGWVLDRSRYQLFDPDNKSVELTTGEFKLLEALVSSPNRTLSREHLFDLTREGKFDVYDRAIDIQIARIRKKLGDDPKTPALIKTVRGVGYMFCGQTSSNAA